MKIKRNHVAVVAVTLIVCLALYINWEYGRAASTGLDKDKTLGEADYTNAQSSDDYFEQVRLNKQQTRDEAKDLFNSIITNKDSLSDDKKQASEDLLKLANNMDKELSIESLIKSKGFKDCVALIGDDSVNVVVSCSKDGLKPNEAAQIFDIAKTESGVETIKIIESKDKT